MEKARVAIREGAIAYVRQGAGEPILLIHGIPTSAYLWRHVIPLLAADFAVCALDLLGYGDSEKPPKADLSLPAQAGYVAEFMMRVGFTHATVAGHDIGGGVAQLLALERPELVKRLVLLDTVAYDAWPVPEIDRLKDQAWDRIIQTLGLRTGFRKALLGGIVHRDRVTDTLVREYVRPFEGLQGGQAYLRCARALNNRDILIRASEIEQLPLPVLILWGEADAYQDVKVGQHLADQLATARLVVLKEAGHFLPEDQPEEITRLVKGFIRETSGR
ncbi:MAG: alpha/beta fold hydrolase [Candidatus Methylomirabilales bacterium]